MQMHRMARVDKYTWREFLSTSGLCSLCGNKGVIPAHKVVGPVGQLSDVGDCFCICPNGRVMKFQSDAQAKKAATKSNFGPARCR
jgi:hypothetical protein